MAQDFVYERLFTTMISANTSEFLKRLVTGIILIICFGGAYVHSATLFLLLLAAVLIEILVIEWPRLVPQDSLKNTLLSIIYPIFPFALLFAMVRVYHATDIYLPIYPFLVAWTADTWGYVVGKLMGNHKIYPLISPGKSWEGFAGGVVGIFILNLLVLPRIHTLSSSFIATNYLNMFFFSAALSAIALMGGFFMSYLKRKNQLKDAGDLLPGHGGFLDRFDSVLFVTVATVATIVLTAFLQ